MALPAGRYGVTKNQLLKIKKLPMNTIKLIEELTEKFDLLGSAAFKNSTSVVTQSTDLVESGAVKDIVGWGNKNLYDYSELENRTTPSSGGITYSDNGNGTVSITAGTTTGVFFTPNHSYLEAGLDIPFEPSTEYIFSLTEAVANLKLEIYYKPTSSNNFTLLKSETGVKEIAFTTPSTFYDILFRIGADSNKSLPSVTLGLMIRKANIVDDSFEPYHASVEESKANKTDVYGLSYANMVEIPANSDLNNYKTAGSFISKISSTTNSLSNCPVTGSGINLHVESTAGGTGQYIIQTVKRSYDNKPEIWKRSYNGTAWGNWFKEVADESLKADTSVIAPVENGSTASQAYAVNDVFIRNGALCKVTSAISQGDTLSNQFTVTNVGAILTALLNA